MCLSGRSFPGDDYSEEGAWSGNIDLPRYSQTGVLPAGEDCFVTLDFMTMLVSSFAIKNYRLHRVEGCKEPRNRLGNAGLGVREDDQLGDVWLYAGPRPWPGI